MVKILWADDEIDLLKPYILFLQAKGYKVIPATDGSEALDILAKESIDVIFLDENMPGLNGLDTLNRVKQQYPSIPVIMITKSEEENIMEQAIGSKISDYLIKPVNPNQILLVLKKHLDTQKLVTQTQTMSYQQDFRNISMRINQGLDYDEWADLYKQLVHWEIELADSNDESIFEILETQKIEANEQFSKYYQKNYIDWINDKGDVPLMSHKVMQNAVFPLLKEKKRPVFFILLDNFRFDQWRILKPEIEKQLMVENEGIYYAILPTTTQYARNALFASLLPSDIKKMFPQYWIDEDKEGNKNEYEPQLLEANLTRHRIKNVNMTYHKVLNATYGMRMIDILPNFMQNDLNVIVYNFIDMLSHARTDSDLVRELASDENAYRGVTLTWYEHSPLKEVLKYLSDKDVDVFITTDHGSVKVSTPVKIKSDRDASVNLRYKIGRLLDYDMKEVFGIKNSADVKIPPLNIMSQMIFARDNGFFVYPTDYNKYVQYYMRTFQHGGISMEECLVPFIHLVPKK